MVWIGLPLLSATPLLLLHTPEASKHVLLAHRLGPLEARLVFHWPPPTGVLLALLAAARPTTLLTIVSFPVLRRGLATAAAPASTSQLTASLLLSRAPLLTRTPSPLAQAYYDRSLKIRHALSNPTATNFYFKPGSLPLRRFQEAEYAKEVEYYGAKLVGKAPDVGDVQPEPELVETARDHWAKADEARGETSLERCPEEELFCLIESKGKWTFPSTEVKAGEGLDEAVTARITGVDGALQGKSLDTWLVTRKPIGVVRDGEKRVGWTIHHL